MNGSLGFLLDTSIVLFATRLSSSAVEAIDAQFVRVIENKPGLIQP